MGWIEGYVFAAVADVSVVSHGLPALCVCTLGPAECFVVRGLFVMLGYFLHGFFLLLKCTVNVIGVCW